MVRTRKKPVPKKKEEKKPKGTCGNCKHCTYVTDFHTLSLTGKPTFGRCPNWTQSKSVLLSLDTCNLFDQREIFNEWLL